MQLVTSFDPLGLSTGRQTRTDHTPSATNKVPMNRNAEIEPRQLSVNLIREVIIRYFSLRRTFFAHRELNLEPPP